MRDAKREVASAARRFLEAIRDGDIETMLTLVVEYPPEWTVARWQEVAEKVRQEYESQPVRLVNLRETAVDPPRYAAVRIYGPSEEKDEYRFLLLMNCISSGWRVSLMDSSPTDVPLQQHLDSIKKLLTFKNLLEDKGEERKRIVFRGLDLTDAPRRRYRDKPVELRSGGVIRTTEGGPLARRDLLVVEVFYVPGKNVFYLRYCSLYTLDSTLYYGPFEGDPFKRLHIARPKSAMQPAQDRTAD